MEHLVPGQVVVELADKIQNKQTGNLPPITDPQVKKDKKASKPEVNVQDRVPANLDHARKHAIAKRVARTKEGCKDVCECCGLQIENELLPLMCDLLDLSFLGPGIPLYFGFLKAAMVLFTVSTFVFSFYGIITNSQGYRCISQDGVNKDAGLCILNATNQFSLINKSNDAVALRDQNILNFIGILILVVTLHLYRRKARQDEESLDFSLISPSDYTAQLYNLPPKYNEKDIRDLVQSWWDKQTPEVQKREGPFEIEKICITYDVNEYMKKIITRNTVNLTLRKNKAYLKKKKVYPPGPTHDQLVEQRNAVQIEIDDLENLVFDGQYDKTTPHCFVTFNTRKIMETLVESQSISLLQNIGLLLRKFVGSDLKEMLQMKKNDTTYYIKVKRAPEPSDVKWENTSATNSQKYTKRFITTLISLMIVGGCFGLIYLLNYWQFDVKSSGGSKSVVTIISVFSSVLIIIINTFLNISTFVLSNMELQSTQTNLNVSIAEKLSIAQFCTSAIITYVVNISLDSDNLWIADGITGKFTIIALSNCFVPPIMAFLNPFELIKKYKQKSIVAINDDGQVSQGEANTLFEGFPLELSIKYASTIKTLWMIGFYTPLSPYLPFIGVITIFLSYMMDKYLLLNRLSRPNLLGSDLNKEMIELMEYFPFTIAIGNLVWMQQLDHEDDTSLVFQILAIVFSALNFIIPSGKLNKMIFKIKEIDDSEGMGTYKQVKYKFSAEYDRCNPITKEEAIKAYFKELQELDSDEAKQKLEEMMNHNTIPKSIMKQLENDPSLSNYITNIQLDKSKKQDEQQNINKSQFNTSSRSRLDMNGTYIKQQTGIIVLNPFMNTDGGDQTIRLPDLPYNLPPPTAYLSHHSVQMKNQDVDPLPAELRLPYQFNMNSISSKKDSALLKNQYDGGKMM